VSILFEPTILKGMNLANRFVRSATWEGMATSEGICTGRLTETMARLAEGGVGLIITSHAYVSREGQASPWQAESMTIRPSQDSRRWRMPFISEVAELLFNLRTPGEGPLLA